MEELHRRLLRIGFGAGEDLGLVLAGGYALTAHEPSGRPTSAAGSPQVRTPRWARRTASATRISTTSDPAFVRRR